jgi:hypothetical protein
MPTILKISSVTQAIAAVLLLFIGILSIIANLLLVAWRNQLEACGPSPLVDTLSMISYAWLFFLFIQIPVYAFSLAVPLVALTSTICNTRALRVTSVIGASLFLLFNAYTFFVIFVVTSFNPGGPSGFSLAPMFSFVRFLVSIVLLVTTIRGVCCISKDKMAYKYEPLTPTM